MTVRVWSDSVDDGAAVPERYALGKDDGSGRIALSDNVSPHVGWGDLPDGTRSVAISLVDADAPTVADDVNQEGHSVAHDLPRAEFVHWVLVDLDPASGGIAEGAHSTSVTAHGKPGGDAPTGGRHGVNDYTGWFAGDADMEGEWYGYDGPCPPWNDERVHRYTLTVYALDTDRLPVSGAFTAADLEAAVEGHVLANGSFAFTYAINATAR